MNVYAHTQIAFQMLTSQEKNIFIIHQSAIFSD